MISSPILTELVRTLSSVPDPAGAFATSIRGLRAAEQDLRRALDDVQAAPSQMERTICIARRNRAMQDLIMALQSVNQVLQKDASHDASQGGSPDVQHPA